jgi:hypothetical protein
VSSNLQIDFPFISQQLTVSVIKYLYVTQERRYSGSEKNKILYQYLVINLRCTINK